MQRLTVDSYVIDALDARLVQHDRGRRRFSSTYLWRRSAGASATRWRAIACWPMGPGCRSARCRTRCACSRVVSRRVSRKSATGHAVFTLRCTGASAEPNAALAAHHRDDARRRRCTISVALCREPQRAGEVTAARAADLAATTVAWSLVRRSGVGRASTVAI